MLVRKREEVFIPLILVLICLLLVSPLIKKIEGLQEHLLKGRPVNRLHLQKKKVKPQEKVIWIPIQIHPLSGEEGKSFRRRVLSRINQEFPIFYPQMKKRELQTRWKWMRIHK